MGHSYTHLTLEDRCDMACLHATGHSIRQTITFDNGTEFARHYDLHALGLDSFFCDTYSPWQKGGVENAIGRLRRTLSRKTDLAALSEEQFTRLVQMYNNTSRKCLGYQTPAEIFRNHLSHFKCESSASSVCWWWGLVWRWRGWMPVAPARWLVGW